MRAIAERLTGCEWRGASALVTIGSGAKFAREN